MDPFALRQLGRSDLKLPRLGFGGAPLGNLFERLPDSEAERTLVAAWEAGVRLFDTSPWYGRGLSEHRIGRFLCGKPRAEALLSTKVGRIFTAPADRGAFIAAERAWAEGLLFEHHHDYTYDGIIRSYEDSLQRLGMDRVDILIVHDLDAVSLGSEGLVEAHLAQLATSGFRALEYLKGQGRIGAIGVGINRLGSIPRFLDFVHPDFFLVALPYTLAEQPALDGELPLCEERGVSVVVGGVFASGILASGPVPGARYNYGEPTPAQQEKVRRLETICRGYGVPLAAAALQFPLHHPTVTSVIPGAIHPEQVRQNVANMRVEIPDALWHELKRERLLREDAPTP